MQRELGGVVLADGAEVVAASLRQGLNRLQGLDGQPLGIADPLGVPPVRLLGRHDPRSGHVDLPAARLDLNLSFDHFARHQIERFKLAQPGLLDHGSGVTARGLFAGA